MPDKSVVFYGIKSEFFPIAFKLIEKMYGIGERVLFLCDNEEEVDFYNSKLWTSARLSFIPSGNRKTIPVEDAEFCHIWFSTEITFQNNPAILIHNGLDISNFQNIEKFQKIIDIFNIEAIESAKTRSKTYSEKGYLNQKLWIQSDTSWTQGELK